MPVNFSAVASSPVQNLKPFRFRAASLGPLFQWHNLKTNLSKIDFDTYRGIIVDRTGKTAPDRDPLTKSELWVDKGLALASEIRADSVILESLGLGADLLRVNDVSKIARDYVEALIRSAPGENGKSDVVDPEFHRLERVLRGLKGEELTGTERALVGLISLQKWDELLSHSKRSILGDQESRPTEKITLIPDLPGDVRFNLMQMFNESVLKATHEDMRAKEERLRREDTEALVSLFKRMRLKEAGAMILQNRGDVKMVPVEDLRLLKDPAVRMEVIRLMGGQSPFLAVTSNPEQEKPIRQKVDSAEDPSKRKRKGKE
jgi:hypothetical protein